MSSFTYFSNNCPDCGENLIGDGYSSHIHCPNVEFDDHDCYEADANPVYCGFEDEDEAQDG